MKVLIGGNLNYQEELRCEAVAARFGTAFHGNSRNSRLADIPGSPSEIVLAFREVLPMVTFDMTGGPTLIIFNY